MPQGRNPIPTKLKILQGNPGKRPLNMDEPEPTRCIPKMPAWLKAFPVAKEEWKREAKILDEMGVLTVADSGALGLRSYLASQSQSLAIDIEVEGMLIDLHVMTRTGDIARVQSKPNPKATQLKNILSEYRQLGSLLGLDPSSRSKLKADNPKTKTKAEAFRLKKKG